MSEATRFVLLNVVVVCAGARARCAPGPERGALYSRGTVSTPTYACPVLRRCVSGSHSFVPEYSKCADVFEAAPLYVAIIEYGSELRALDRSSGITQTARKEKSPFGRLD